MKRKELLKYLRNNGCECLFVKGLEYWLKLSGISNEDAILLYGGNKKIIFKDINIFPWGIL